VNLYDLVYVGSNTEETFGRCKRIHLALKS